MAYLTTEDYSTPFVDSYERARIFPTFSSFNWDGDSILHGDNYPNSFYGNGGDDRIYSHGSNDKVRGGSDNDTLILGSGNDIGWGNSGDDIIYGDQDNSINVRTNIDKVRAVRTTENDDRDEVYFFSLGYTNNLDTLYQGRISPIKNNNNDDYYNGDDYYGMHDHPDPRDPNVRFNIGLSELNLKPGEKAVLTVT
ncbi:MAG: calcium-binding protein [Crocosphaera sp.]